jgi:uncharacterized protein YlaI
MPAITVYLSNEMHKLAKENKLKFSRLLREKIKEELEKLDIDLQEPIEPKKVPQLKIEKNLEILKKIQIENPHLKVKEQVKLFKELTGLSRPMFFRYKRLLNGVSKQLDEFKRYPIDKDKCYFCQKEEKLFVHHIDFNRLNNNPENLIVLCSNCHRRLHQILNKTLNAPNFNKKVLEEISAKGA